VIASDGVNTGEPQSDAAFTLVPGLPRTVIVEPDSGAQFEWGSTIALRGRATHTEDGSLDESAFAWTSDLDGALGSGRELWVSDLVTGTHHITLTATDSDGQTGTDEITIFVRASRVYLPIVWKNHQ
jgi:hypothetical protein